MCTHIGASLAGTLFGFGDHLVTAQNTSDFLLCLDHPLTALLLTDEHSTKDVFVFRDLVSRDQLEDAKTYEVVVF